MLDTNSRFICSRSRFECPDGSRLGECYTWPPLSLLCGSRSCDGAEERTQTWAGLWLPAELMVLSSRGRQPELVGLAFCKDTHLYVLWSQTECCRYTAGSWLSHTKRLKFFLRWINAIWAWVFIWLFQIAKRFSALMGLAWGPAWHFERKPDIPAGAQRTQRVVAQSVSLSDSVRCSCACP